MSEPEDPSARKDASKESPADGHAASDSSPPERLVPDGPRALGAWLLLGLALGLGLVGFVLHHLIAAQRP